jgi:hypothetical protein
MRNFFLLLILCSFLTSHSQTESNLIRKTPLATENFVGCDYDFNYYYFSNAILSKQTETEIITYSNFLYGNITSVDITNPLKIVVFYQEFNVVILLDSQLNETDIIQLPYDISFATKGTANHLWLYTTNSQTIENYNFKTNTIASKSQPLKNTEVLNMKSTENYVYLMTKTVIKTFDYMGNFIKEEPHEKTKDFQYSNRILYTLSNDTIYKSEDINSPIVFPTISKIEKFYTLNNHFFIFDGSQLYLFSTEKK